MAAGGLQKLIRGVREMIDCGLQGSTPGQSRSKQSSLACEGNGSYSFA